MYKNNYKNSLLALVLSLLLLPLAANANDNWQVEVGASATNSDLFGSAVRVSQGLSYDLGSDLGYDRTHVKTLLVGLKNKKSGWPNFRISWQGYDESAQGQLGPASLQSRLKVSQLDFLAYYSWKQPAYYLDVGFDIHRLNVDFNIHVNVPAPVPGAPAITEDITQKASQTFPAFYLAGDVNLFTPKLGLYFESYYSRFDTKELRNDSAGLRWQPVEPLRVNLGYHYGRLKYGSDKIGIDAKTKGPYLGMNVAF